MVSEKVSESVTVGQEIYCRTISRKLRVQIVRSREHRYIRYFSCSYFVHGQIHWDFHRTIVSLQCQSICTEYDIFTISGIVGLIIRIDILCQLFNLFRSEEHTSELQSREN